jgi:hypothetical protein
MAALLADLPSTRLREVTSATAHYIAGVLDRETMMQIVEQMCAAASLTEGARVQTLRGTAQGVVLRVLEDGRILWRTTEGTELIALPEALMPAKPGT